MQQNDIINQATTVFQANFRTDIGSQAGETRSIGLENEYLMVSSDGSILRPEVLQHLWGELEHHGWSLSRDAYTSEVISACKMRPDNHQLRTHNYDVITTDYGYATLEINLAPVKRIQDAYQPLCEIVELVTSVLDRYDARLLGYGVQPVTKPDRHYLGPKSRYKLIYDVRDNEQELNPGSQSVDLHCMNASCQTQVEVSLDEAIPLVNALNATSGLRIALFANSSVWQNKVSDFKAIRELFWDWCWPDRKQQVGIPPKFFSIQHYVDYLLDLRPIAINRDQIFYRLNSNTSFRHFLTNKGGQQGIAVNGDTTLVSGRPEDIKTQYAFAWIDTRLQPIHGTVEDRVSCQQPPDAHFSSSAVTLGLVENYQELVAMADALSIDQWKDIRMLACKHGMNFSYPGVNVRELIQQLLHIAYVGLKKRGFDEEVYLEPLYTRVESGRNPADEINDRFHHDGVGGLIAYNDMRRLLTTLRVR